MQESLEGRRQFLWIAIAVISIALTVVFANLWIGARGIEPGEVNEFILKESSPAEATATDVITAITTYDSDTIEEVRSQLLELSTGSFREDYEALLEGGLGQVLEESAIDSTGDIVDGPDVGFSSATEAIAVARVVQDVTSRETPGGRTVFLVIRLGLILEDETWKADSLRILSQQIL